MPEGDRAESVIADWLERRERGDAPDPAAVIRAHPDLASALQQRFSALNLVDLALTSRGRGPPDVPDRLGPYRILDLLGRGGMGTVYRARVESPTRVFEAGRVVALKVLHPHLLESPGFFKRFLREAEIGRSVEHPNVVRTWDADALVVEDRSYHFLVMEYVAGQTLHDLQVELECVPEELCRHVAVQTARGLAAIHAAGVVHRDLKPENVIVTEDHAVKVMDLGVARLAEEAIRLSRTGHFVGSVEYASPEQFSARTDGLDGRSDLYSLGVVLYELATGHHPFRDDDARVVLQRILQEEPRKAGLVNPQLSPFLEELIDVLLRKRPEERFGSAAELLDVLEAGERGAWWKTRARALQGQAKRPLRRIRIPRETALYGREDDLALLRAAYEQARAGEGRVLLVEGEAGIGKSRLVDELVARLQQDGEDLNALYGSYPPGGAATATGAFSTAYREHFGPEGLEDALRMPLAETPRLIPAFAALLRGDTAPGSVPQLRVDALQTLFVNATRALAAERPTVVLIDDLHFAPAEGRALFSSLAVGVPGHRVLLVGTLRPGVPEAWKADLQRLDHATLLPLTRLGPKHLVGLLKDAFRSERLAQELGIQIAEKSDGNPFFAFEIIRGLREGQLITQRPDGSWDTTQIIRDIRIPSTVRDLIRARISELDDDERSLLEVAACCGYEFDGALVGHVLGQGVIPALQRLGRIETRHRLVRSVGARHAFDHHQVQEALYEGLNERLRQAYHAAIADAIGAGPDVAGKEPEEVEGALCVDLCEHHLRGGQAECALPYLRRALKHLQQGAQLEHGAELARRALGEAGLLEGALRLDVLRAAVDLLERLGDREEQEALLLEARELAATVGSERRVAQIARLLGGLYCHTGRLEEARAQFEASLAYARAAGDRAEEQKSTGNLGVVLCEQGRLDEARRAYEQSLDIAREIGDEVGETYELEHLANHASTTGDHARATELITRVIEDYREMGDLNRVASASSNLAVAFERQGRLAEAEDALAQALSAAGELGDRRSACHARQVLAAVCSEQGRHREALTHAEAALALARETRSRYPQINSMTMLGNLAYASGELDRARAHLEDAAALAEQVGWPRGRAFALANLGTLVMHLGRFEAARARLEEGIRVARASGPDGRGDILAQLGSLYVEMERIPDALRAFEETRNLAREAGRAPLEATSLLGTGHALCRAGRAEEAAVFLEQACTLEGDVPPPIRLFARGELALVRPGEPPPDPAVVRELADQMIHSDRMGVWHVLWQLTGDVEHLREARRHLDHLVEHAPADCRASMLENVRLHREILEAWAEYGDEAGGTMRNPGG